MGRTTLVALQEFDASKHVLVILDHDTSSRESNALSLARWEGLDFGKVSSLLR